MTKTASAAYYTSDTKIAYQRQNSDAAFASLAYRCSSSKEGFVALVILQDVAQANWRPTKGVGNHNQGRPGAPLRAASLRLRTVEDGLLESL